MTEKLAMFNGDCDALCIALIRENRDLTTRLGKMQDSILEYQKIIKDYRLEAGIRCGIHKD